MRNFSKGYYVHKNFMDVAIEVVKIQYRNDRRTKLKIRWYNRGWVGQPFELYGMRPTTISVKHTDINNWVKIFTLERYVDTTT